MIPQIKFINNTAELQISSDIPLLVSQSLPINVEVLPGAIVQNVVAISGGVGGPPSGGEQYVRFYRPTPSTEHTVAHNFGRIPIVQVYTLGGADTVGTILVTENLATVYFNTPEACLIICR